MFVKNIGKIFATNIALLLIFIVSIELFFGYWFDKNNFGPHMREHRMKNQRIILKNDTQEIEYFYRRNYHGFRGADIDPSKIEGIILGGSVIDERYKPEEFTITEFLNKKLKKNNINIKFINGGIEAQTTAGMISAFDNWLLKLENFAPKFIIFYVGINDVSLSNDAIIKNINDGHLLNPNKTEAFFDNIKSRSIIIDSVRKFKFKYLPRKGFVKYDGKLSQNYLKNYDFIKYENAKKKYNLKILKKKHEHRVKSYLIRIDLLEKYSKKIKSIPIFINNIGSTGHQEIIFTLNSSLIGHCIEKNYNCIDLASKLHPEKELWIDGVHTTIMGSSVIVDTIYPDIEKIITKLN